MKRLFLLSMVFLLLSMAVAWGNVAIFPANDDAVTYAGENVTKTVTITNVNSTLPISLPTTVSFTAGSITQLINVYYNVSNPLSLPSPGNSIGVGYTLSIPPTMEAGSYTGTISFENSPLTFTLDVIGRLYIDDLDITVDNVLEDEEEKDRNVEDGDTVDAEVKPGSIVIFNFRIGNAFSDADDIEIKDVVIEVTIDEIDDGDELEDESDDFDIDTDDKSDRVEIEFEIPLEIEEGDYTTRILVTGEDEDDVEHEVYWEIELEVEKESHFIYIKDSDLAPSSIGCDRRSSLDVELLNIGSHDEDEVILEIKNLALGVDIREEDLELEEDIDDDNSYEGTYDIDIDDDVVPGTYTITIKSYYKEGKLSDTATAELVVGECASQPTQTTQTQPTQTTQTQQTTTQPSIQYSQPSTIINPPIITQSGQSSVETSFMGSRAYVIILVLVNVIGIVVLVTLIVKTLIRK